ETTKELFFERWLIHTTLVFKMFLHWVLCCSAHNFHFFVFALYQNLPFNVQFLECFHELICYLGYFCGIHYD
ncbi:hypothetical protein NDU88_011056, partial [Pleurodeles waltl]